jgi:hypothetical protein
MAERSGGRVHRRSRAGIGFLTPTAQADMSSRGQRGRAVSTRPPDCGGRGHGFRTAIPTSATAAGLVRGMKLSSFLGWRSRTLTAAFTARNHEEQSRTARGMRHARPRPHAVGLPRPNPLDRVPTLRPPRPLQHRPPHREIRRRQAPELRHILANCPKAKSFSIHDRCQTYCKDTRASTPATLRE